MLGRWDWLPGWVSNLFKNDWGLQIIFPLSGTTLALWGYLLYRRKVRYDGEIPRQGWLILAPTLVGMVVWFFSASGLRYGFFLFWILAATIIAQTFPMLFQVTSHRFVVKTLFIFLVMGTLPISFPVLTASIQYQNNPVKTFVSHLFIKLDPDHWFFSVNMV